MIGRLKCLLGIHNWSVWERTHRGDWDRRRCLHRLKMQERHE